MTNPTADYYRQIRRLNIPASTAKQLADGLAAGGGQLPPELLPLATNALKTVKKITPADR